MAVKWHVNGEGKPGKCAAPAGRCPFGGDAPHFGTKREAEAAAEALIAREMAAFGGGDVGEGVRDAFALLIVGSWWTLRAGFIAITVRMSRV